VEDAVGHTGRENVPELHKESCREHLLQGKEREIMGITSGVLITLTLYTLHANVNNSIML